MWRRVQPGITEKPEDQSGVSTTKAQRMEQERKELLKSVLRKEDPVMLSPTQYSDIVGQPDCVARLRSYVDFYRKNGSTPEHILIVGEEGMGKTTLATAVANDLGARSAETEASQFKHYINLFNPCRDNEVVILRGLSGLRRNMHEFLLQLLRTGKIEIRTPLRLRVLDARPFTIVGTVTKKTDCSSDLLGCFSLVLPLQPYAVESLEQIAARIAAEAHLDIAPEARHLIALNSGGRPHNVESLIQRMTRAVQKQQITLEDAVQTFHAFGINVHTSEHPASSPHLEQMSGIEFEQTVTELLIRMGFRAEMTKATGDGGIDIVAALDKPIVGGKYLFQCKRYAADSAIGAAIVREFYGAVAAEGAAKGILITTSDFTSQARTFAERVGIELIDSVRLQQLLSQFEMADWPSA